MRDQDDHQPEEGSGGFGPRDAIAAVRRRGWLIALIAVTATAVALAFAYSLPNLYEAEATVQIDPRKKTIVSLEAVLPDIAGDTPTIESQVEILRSRVIALRVIDALGLRSDPEFAPAAAAGPFAWLTFGGGTQPVVIDEAAAAKRRLEAAVAARSAGGPDAADVGADRPERDAVAATFAGRLKTQRVRNSLVVEIRFTSRDPVKAARIANTIAEVYIRDQIDMKIRATGLAAELLEPKLAGLREKVSEAEHRIARFKAENGIIDVEGQLLSEKQLARLMEQTVMARNTAAEARARYEQVRQAIRSGEGRNVTDVLQSQTVRMLKDLHAKATRHEAELLTKYGPKHPELLKARAEIADVDAQLSREMEQIVAGMRNEYLAAEERERVLGGNLNQLKDQQSVSKEVSIKLRDLEREAETSRRVFESFLIRYKQTTEAQELHLPDARIVEKADVPNYPSSPKRKQIALIGLVGGLLCGFGLTLLLELTATGLSRPDEAETTLGVPHLASVPRLKRQSDGLTDPMQSLRVVLSHPQGAFARMLWLLQGELDKRRVDPAARIILVASSLPNEGKTLIAANLALASVARGASTLLIDCDMRRSSLTQQFDLAEAPGLLDAIAYGQDFERMILKDTVSGLAILPAGGGGRVALSPVEALEAPAFGQRLARLKAHFDTIIIDAPPLLPVVDARILADFADQIVFVALWRRTPKDIIRRAARLLGANSAKIAGLVLNQVDPVEHAKGLAKRPARPARGPTAHRHAA